MDCTTRPASDKGRVGVTAVFIFIGLFVLNIVFGKSQLLYSQNIKHTTTPNPFHFRRVNTTEAKDWGTVEHQVLLHSPSGGWWSLQPWQAAKQLLE